MFIQVVASLWVTALGLWGLRAFTNGEDSGLLLAGFQAIVLIAIWAPVT